MEEVVDEEDDTPPELETVDLEELNKNKEQQQKEWLKNVVNDTEKQKMSANVTAKAQESKAMMEAASGLLSNNQ